MEQILIINGPNLNLLGKREPHVYGHSSFEDFLEQLQKQCKAIAQIDYFQSNHEGELIDRLHKTEQESYVGVILNAGAYTHTSVALADAVSAIKTPVLEVHISNVFKRETFRQHSYLSPVCVGTIGGLGLRGYELGVWYFCGSPPSYLPQHQNTNLP